MDILNPMEDVVEILRKDSQKVYTVDNIQRMKLMPWARNSRTIVKILQADIQGPNFLGTQITGTDKHTCYLVPKKQLIKYLQIHGPGLMALARKPKRKIYGRNTKSEGSGENKTR